jgi:hypothetical protein
MRIGHYVIGPVGLTRVSKWLRGAIGVGIVSILTVAVTSVAAGADGAPTSTTSSTVTTPNSTSDGTITTSTTTSSVTGPGGTKVARNSGAILSPAAEKANATTPAPISGTGSSFASPAIGTWTNTVKGSPYSVTVNWAPSNSGTGRYEFTNQTTDFAVSDVG